MSLYLTRYLSVHLCTHMTYIVTLWLPNTACLYVCLSVSLPICLYNMCTRNVLRSVLVHFGSHGTNLFFFKDQYILFGEQICTETDFEKNPRFVRFGANVNCTNKVNDRFKSIIFEQSSHSQTESLVVKSIYEYLW